MKNINIGLVSLTSLASLIMILAQLSVSNAEVKIDEPAPNFSEKDTKGKTVALKDFKGQWLVLEWTNKDCPYVKKHYGSKNMQSLQKECADKGVKWVSVISSADGKQGYLTPTEAIAHAETVGAAPFAILLDSDGSMGKAFEAKTTPHIFVINPLGKLVYAGAIDDNDSSDPETIKTAKNYLKQALDAGMSGKEISIKSTKPYGCGVKYQN